MSPRPHQTLFGWLLLAVLMLVAVAPPAGLEVCVGEDGHMHIGVGDPATGEVDGDCICVDDGCACLEESHGHKDFGIDSVALVQRESENRSTIVVPAPELAPPVLFAAPEVGVERRERFVAFAIEFERPPQWPAAQRTLVLRS